MNLIDKKVFILRNKSIVETCLAFIKTVLISDESPFEVVIRRYKSKRTNQQNNTYWGRLDDISEQVGIQGRKFEPIVWHEHMKEKFLPDECAKGIDKWMFMIDGSRRLKMSTTDLNTKEFYDYRLQVEAYGAELGVMFTTRELI